MLRVLSRRGVRKQGASGEAAWEGHGPQALVSLAGGTLSRAGSCLGSEQPLCLGWGGSGHCVGWVRSGWRLGSVGPLLALGHVRWRLLWKAVFPRRDSLFGGAVSSLWPSGWDSRAWLWDRRCQRGATSVTLHWECAVSCTWPAEHSLFQSLFTSPVSPLPT